MRLDGPFECSGLESKLLAAGLRSALLFFLVPLVSACTNEEFAELKSTIIGLFILLAVVLVLQVTLFVSCTVFSLKNRGRTSPLARHVGIAVGAVSALLNIALLGVVGWYGVVTIWLVLALVTSLACSVISLRSTPSIPARR